jgi:Streptomyces sporulation and cell division protein, SsgA
MSEPGSVTRAVGGLLRADDQPDLWLPVLLRWTPSDPFAVRMVLLVDTTSSVEWLLSRELLTEALTGPAGCGDVHVRVDGSDVVVDLAGECCLLMPLADVVEVLTASYAVVPTGSEAVSEAAFAALLGA